MKITAMSEAVTSFQPADSTHFTGPAALSTLAQTSAQAPSIFAAVVRFEPGARNHWHSHPGGQLLQVIEGEGWVQARGKAPRRIRKDDTVTCDPGEEHWHGAGRHGPMTHLAVAVGETRWLEESEAPAD